MTDSLLAKDRAMNADRIARIGREIKAVLPEFDAAGFAADVMADLPQLELKARIDRTAQGLHDHLPVTGGQALETLLCSLPPTPQAAGITNDFGLHIYSPHSEYVARYCRAEETLQPALDALRRFTCYFSAEAAVRYFLNDFPEETMKAAGAWAADDDYRVRRLASESTRPRLPWAIRIRLPVDAAIPILDHLSSDTSHFVLQSVANHLRDIAVSAPELVLATLTRWKSEGHAGEAALSFIAREALKTRLKQGWRPAYEFLGFDSDVPVHLSPIRLESTELTVGGTLAFAADLTSTTKAPIFVTYVISSTTPTGKHREAVYFLKRTTVDAGQHLQLIKKHLLRSAGTRKVTPGPHTLELQVNGQRFPPVAFQVFS